MSAMDANNKIGQSVVQCHRPHKEQVFMRGHEQSPGNSDRAKLLGPKLGSVWQNKHSLLERQKEELWPLASEGQKKKGGQIGKKVGTQERSSK